MRKLNLILLIISSLAISACGQGGELSLERGAFPWRLSQASGADFVSSSDQNQVSSPNGYTAQTSIGTFSSGLPATTTTNGYKVFSSIQGSLISNQ